MSDPNKAWNRGVRIPPDLWQHVLRTARRGRGNIPETSGYIRDLIRRDMEERGAYVVEAPGKEKRKPRSMELHPCQTCGRLHGMTCAQIRSRPYCSMTCYENRKK